MTVRSSVTSVKHLRCN